DKLVLGEWCWSFGRDGIGYWTEEYIQPSDTCDSDKPDNVLTIWPNGLGSHEVECRFTTIRTKFDRTIPLADKTPLGVNGHNVTAICGRGVGRKWTERFTFYYTMGMLAFKTKSRTSNEELERMQPPQEPENPPLPSREWFERNRDKLLPEQREWLERNRPDLLSTITYTTSLPYAARLKVLSGSSMPSFTTQWVCLRSIVNSRLATYIASALTIARRARSSTVTNMIDVGGNFLAGIGNDRPRPHN